MRGIIIFLVLLFAVPVFAGELENLQSQKNQISLSLRLIQERSAMLGQQLQDYIVRYAADRKALEDRFSELSKQLQEIDVKIKALE